ncbi:hypothetical protein ACFVQ0_17950 [Streptomyces sp. NPDC057900]|uniref:hypothetical protein n=1 Tax=Streptomyces sp. NPDC057900 TaxID=3346274 RepID=UPI0036ED492E
MTPTRQLLGRDLPPLFATPDLPGARTPVIQGHWCRGAAETTETTGTRRAGATAEHLPAERAPTCTEGARRPAVSGHSLAEE